MLRNFTFDPQIHSPSPPIRGWPWFAISVHRSQRHLSFLGGGGGGGGERQFWEKGDINGPAFDPSSLVQLVCDRIHLVRHSIKNGCQLIGVEKIWHNQKPLQSEAQVDLRWDAHYLGHHLTQDPQLNNWLAPVRSPIMPTTNMCTRSRFALWLRSTWLPDLVTRC